MSKTIFSYNCNNYIRFWWKMQAKAIAPLDGSVPVVRKRFYKWGGSDECAALHQESGPLVA
jgi:hypothetical protein